MQPNADESVTAVLLMPPPRPRIVQILTPNVISLIRLACVFPVMVCIWDGITWLAIGIFIPAMLTDMLDGWWARRWNMTSKFGAWLDAATDKVLEVPILVLAVTIYVPHMHPMAKTIMWLYVGAEILLIMIRVWKTLLERAWHTNITQSAKHIGKVKVWAIATAIVSFLLSPTQSWAYNLGELALLVSFVTVAISAKLHVQDIGRANPHHTSRPEGDAA